MPSSRSARRTANEQCLPYAVDARSFTCSSSIVDGNPGPGIHYPSAIACGPSSTSNVKSGPTASSIDLYVLDTSNRLFVIDKQGVARKTIGGHGAAPGCLRSAQGVAVSADGQSVFVADTGNDRVQKFRVYDSQLQAIAGGPPRPGQPKRFGLQALSQPHGIVVHGERVYVSDTWNHRIVVLNANEAQPTQFRAAVSDANTENITELPMLSAFGTKGRATGCFQFPKGLAVAPPWASEKAGGAAELIVADSRNHRIQCFTLEGKFTRGVSGDGGGGPSEHAGRMSGSSLFTFPSSVCVSAPFGGARYLFVADQRGVTLLELGRLEPICVLALSNPARLRSARPTSHTAAALCTHALPNRTGPLPLYVAEYDEHAIREVVLGKDDVRSAVPIDASGATNILGSSVHRPLGWVLPKPHVAVDEKPRAKVEAASPV
jgi:hypothetical protein